MAVSVKVVDNTPEFIVLSVEATTADGTQLPEFRRSLSKSGLAAGNITVEGERAKALAEAERQIRNYEAAQKALRELE